MNDVVLNKRDSIARCIRQVHAYYRLTSEIPFEQDHLRQDAIAINLQRIVEMALDLANHLVRREKLGLPQDSAGAFALLHRAGLIPDETFHTLRGMIGFRNILVHEYQRLDLSIMIEVIERRLEDCLAFADLVVQRCR